MIRFSKIVSSLPASLDNDTIYFVRNGAGFDIYVTNKSGVATAYSDNNWKMKPVSGLIDGVNNIIGTADAVPVHVVTNNQKRITALSNGNVGIGNDNPDYNLDVAGDIHATQRLLIGDNSANKEEVKVLTNGNGGYIKLQKNNLVQGDRGIVFGALSFDKAWMDENGWFGFGVKYPQASLHTTGSAIVEGDMTINGNANMGAISCADKFYTDITNPTIDLNFSIHIFRLGTNGTINLPDPSGNRIHTLCNYTGNVLNTSKYIFTNVDAWQYFTTIQPGQTITVRRVGNYGDAWIKIY